MLRSYILMIIDCCHLDVVCVFVVHINDHRLLSFGCCLCVCNYVKMRCFKIVSGANFMDRNMKQLTLGG